MFFTVPLVISDGSGNRTFNFQMQEPGLSPIGRYNEPASTASAESRLRVAHYDVSRNGRKRHLIQSSEIVVLVNPGEGDPADDVIIANITIEHHPKHSEAAVEKRLKLALAAAGIAGTTASLMQGNV